MNKEKFLAYIKSPPVYIKVLVYFGTIITAAASVLLLVFGGKDKTTSILSYCVFVLAAIFLSYSVYLIVKAAPKIKDKVVILLKKRDFTNRLLDNFGFRTVVFSAFSFFMSLIFAAFNGYLGYVNKSVWYGALAAYYVFNALLRGGILFFRIKSNNKDDKLKNLTNAKIYRNSGIVLLIINVAMTSAIVQMVFYNAHFSYAGWTVYAYAAYAFYKITASVISFIKAKKQTDLTVSAIRNVNLTGAFVSVLALQTALLATFDRGGVNVSLFNALSGFFVAGITVFLGVYMIAFASKKIKDIKGRINDER